MDAAKYLTEKFRMCKHYSCCQAVPNQCPLSKVKKQFNCSDWAVMHPTEAVAIVEKWSAEHPVKTNAEKFKEVFGTYVACIDGAATITEAWWDAPYEEPKEE